MVVRFKISNHSFQQKTETAIGEIFFCRRNRKPRNDVETEAFEGRTSTPRNASERTTPFQGWTTEIQTFTQFQFDSKKKSFNKMLGRVGFEPTKAYASGFTIRSSWPLWYRPFFQVQRRDAPFTRMTSETYTKIYRKEKKIASPVSWQKTFCCECLQPRKRDRRSLTAKKNYSLSIVSNSNLISFQTSQAAANSGLHLHAERITSPPSRAKSRPSLRAWVHASKATRFATAPGAFPQGCPKVPPPNCKHASSPKI